MRRQRLPILALLVLVLLAAGAAAQSGTPYPPNCVASGPGLLGGKAGALAEFLIQAFDDRNQPVTVGGAAWSVEVDGQLSGVPRIVDLGNGNYTVSFNRTSAGVATIQVSLDRVPVAGSPFRPLLEAGAPSPRSCRLSGDGLRGGTLSRQTEFGLSVTVMDAWGNRRGRGGDPVYTSLRGPVEIGVDMVDLENGAYAGRFEVVREGIYQLSITLGPGGPHLGESPLSVRFRDKEPLKSSELQPWLLALVGGTLGLALLSGAYCACAKWQRRRALERQPLLIERLSGTAF